MKKVIRVGLIGAGWMGKAHSQCFAAQSTVFGPEPEVIREIVADATDDLARTAAAQFGYNRYTGEWRELVADKSVDIVDIVTPHNEHYEMAMAAIANGKHVYCEKPLTNDAESAARIARAADEAGVITMVGFNYLKNPVQTLARRIIRSGEIGEIKYFGAWMNGDFVSRPGAPHTWRNVKTRAGSGAAGDMGSHLLGYYYDLIDGDITELLATMNIVVPEMPVPAGPGEPVRFAPNETDDIAFTLFHFNGGQAHGHIECSRVALGRKFDCGYNIVGSTGAIRYSYDNIDKLELYRDVGPAELRGFTEVEIGPFDPRFAAFHPVPGFGLGFNDFKMMEVRDIIEAVAAGRSVHPDFRFAAKVQRVIDAALKSNDEHRWVALEEIAV